MFAEGAALAPPRPAPPDAAKALVELPDANIGLAPPVELSPLAAEVADPEGFPLPQGPPGLPPPLAAREVAVAAQAPEAPPCAVSTLPASFTDPVDPGVAAAAVPVAVTPAPPPGAVKVTVPSLALDDAPALVAVPPAPTISETVDAPEVSLRVPCAYDPPAPPLPHAVVLLGCCPPPPPPPMT